MNRRKAFLVGLAIVVIAIIWNTFLNEKEDTCNYLDPKTHGIVPDEYTAIKIAEAMLVPVYGQGVYAHRPFTAKLEDSLWHIKGTKVSSGFGGIQPNRITSIGCIGAFIMSDLVFFDTKPTIG